mgnify:CR=1 FL=1
MVLRCKICFFDAEDRPNLKNIKYRELNIRKHIREKHADLFPKSTYEKSLFFKKNIIYVKARILNYHSDFFISVTKLEPRHRRRCSKHDAKEEQKTDSFCPHNTVLSLLSRRSCQKTDEIDARGLREATKR